MYNIERFNEAVDFITKNEKIKYLTIAKVSVRFERKTQAVTLSNNSFIDHLCSLHHFPQLFPNVLQPLQLSDSQRLYNLYLISVVAVSL